MTGLFLGAHPAWLRAEATTVTRRSPGASLARTGLGELPQPCPATPCSVNIPGLWLASLKQENSPSVVSLWL